MRKITPLLFFVGTIALLGYLVTPDRRFPEQAKRVAAKVQINTFEGALGQYKQDTGAFPTNEQGLSALRTNPGVKGWNGPYLSQDVRATRGTGPIRISIQASIQTSPISRASARSTNK